MSWLRKLVHVFAVIGLAALSSIPFKRNAPQTSSAHGPANDSQVTTTTDSPQDNGSSVDPRHGGGFDSAASPTVPTPTAASSTVPDSSGSSHDSTRSSRSDGTTDTGARDAAGRSESIYGSGPIGPNVYGSPPPTSYGVTESSATSSFSGSDRPLPEDDSTSVRPAAVARLEIRAPRIVGDPPRDVRIRDDEPVPSMGASFEPLWQPEASKRRIVGPEDGLPDGKPATKKPAAKPEASGEERDTDATFGPDRRPHDATTTARGDKHATLRRHRVIYGDSLESLAAQYLGDATRADAIYELNRELIPDRYSLPVGIELSIPSESE